MIIEVEGNHVYVYGSTVEEADSNGVAVSKLMWATWRAVSAPMASGEHNVLRAYKVDITILALPI